VFTACGPEDGRNYRPKRAELIEIINKLLLLHSVGCLYYHLYQRCTVTQHQIDTNGMAFVRGAPAASMQTTRYVQLSEKLPRNRGVVIVYSIRIP